MREGWRSTLEFGADLPGEVVWVLLAVVGDSSVVQLVLTQTPQWPQQHLEKGEGEEERRG